eukprot:Gregarina_sp_Pseudo_9__808@NODE_1517_length_1530_cov_48_054997_g1405_i0_p1_GENE_NODE_1517_length_1530_cov_48_054997_g1405_i0NODE_1517_length_1530_cov_48_054997_g1405_i0_p1_ORF_typecomplete_len315_score25_76BORCS6/PF10157_9/0_024BORCS6/PF10157_9/46Taxilin/PF09728_9/0_003BAR/PF03114_18/0_015DUF2433/PF10360_9/1_6e03DUF2433/PF10360_9/0_031HsbA/PF12296_8/0_25BLI1/PF17324_2/2_6e02BLI1/PF17324_2/1_3BLI1/PF17324_2/37Apolipoprotein/PF01442_18/0_25DUF1640/PF07798_11/1_1e03DUF1640/PF07798_11/0_018Mer2/PF09
MQRLTKTFTRAVSGSSTRKKTNGCMTNIPHDPLNASRLELESIQNLLASLHDSCQWFLVTAYHFAAKSEYVSKLATSATQAIERIAPHMAEFEQLANDLKQRSDTQLTGSKTLLDVIERLAAEIQECLERFNSRREVFQSAVLCQLKIKKIDCEIAKFPAEEAPALLTKESEKYKKKLSQVKQDFKAQNASLQHDVESLLERARPVSARILSSLLHHEAALYTRLDSVSQCLGGAESVLQEIAADENLLTPASARAAPVIRSGFEEPTPTTMPTRLTTRMVPSPKAGAASPAQMFLLTARVSPEQESSKVGCSL